MKTEPFYKNIEADDLSFLESYYAKSVDPTTIQTVIKIGAQILSFFEEDDSNIEELLDQVLAEIEQIKISLREIIEALEEIKILILTQWTDYVKFELIARIETIHLLMKAWNADPDNPANVEERRFQLAELIKEANLAKQYGFTHYMTMIMALKTELILIATSHSDNSDEFKKAAVLRYKSYFLEALNENRGGSFTNVLKKTNAAMATLSTDHRPRTYTEKWDEEWWEGHWDTPGRKWYERKLRITGNIDSGFRFNYQTTLLRRRSGRRFRDWLKSQEVSKETIITKSLENYERSYNNAHQSYQVHKHNKLLAQAAINVLEKQLELIEAY